MEIRILAGWRDLRRAAAVGGVCLLAVTGLLAQVSGATGQFGKPEDPSASEPKPSIERPMMYPRANYVWPFATGPNYGEVASRDWNKAGVLHTRVGSFDLSRGMPALPATLRTSNQFGQESGLQYFVLQVDPTSFADGRFDRVKELINSQGGAIVQEMPVAAFVVRLTSSAFAGIQAAGGVTTLEPYHPAFKLSPAIGRAPLPNAEKALSDVYTLEAMLFKGEDAPAVAQALGKMGANVVSVLPDMIRFELNRSKLGDAAGIEAIESIHEFLPVYPHGEETSASVQTARPKGGTGGIDLAYTAAGIDGSGNGIAGTSAQILMVLDSGIQVDAGDLADTRALAGTVGAAHRKVKLYTTTNSFAGVGDALGCDAPASGSFTHGHMVAASALGAANRVPVGYGAPWVKTDTNGNPWKFDGVAPGAVLMAYDANVTPALLGCSDPSNSGLNVGNVYTAGSLNSGSLGDAYSRGARTSNFSWGSTSDETYSSGPQKIDAFLFENKDAMVFLSAGNDSEDIDQDTVPDNGTVNAPANSKNATVIGASNTFAASGLFGNTRAAFSSVGPATTLSNRVAPVLMAPGTDTGTNGLAAEYACRTSDNDSLGATECDISQGAAGTSFASPNAAGAGLVVRDYFAQGFYPDGTTANSGNLADRVPSVSGALVKSVLIASADWMNFFDAAANKWTNQATPPMNMQYRFNNQQGYGRIQLNNVLPLSTYSDTPTGLVVCDGGIAGGVCNIAGLSGTASPSTTETYTFDVADNTQELRIAISWIEGAGESLTKDIDIELTNPGGTITYWGNYFTDDDNRNFVIDAGENCDYTNAVPWPGASPLNEPDFSPWSLPSCANSNRDTQNPTEAIMLSPDAALDGLVDNPDTTNINEGSDNQIQTGTWTLRVIGRAFAGTQPYAIAMTGPVSLGSSLRIQRVRPDGELGTGAFICNDRARIDVNEVAEGADPAGGLSAAEISSRTTVQVVDPVDGIFGNGNDVIRDTESNLTFTDLDGAGAGLKFTSNLLLLTDGTAPEPGNGALDVKSGWRIIVRYQDESGGAADPNKLRINSALVDCSTQILAGGVVWGQFGKDAFSLVNGGCEKDLRNMFTFGFPDKYMDEGELIDYRLAFQSTETTDLEDVRVTLKPVLVDADSPATCLPGSTDCADPNRANNATFGLVTVQDSPKIIGMVRAGTAISANFSLTIGSPIPANTVIEMLLGVSARKSGKPVESFAVSRHPLNRDEFTLFYSTDFPAGGVQQKDTNNNELIETATTDEKLFAGDYRLETTNWSSLTATGRNGAINAPWNFDTNDGGFRSGLQNATNTSVLATLALWGEDRNFNNVLDSGEDRDSVNGILDQGWSTLGGCGWQTSSGANRGVWHTGRINNTSSANCTFAGNGNGRCQTYETFPGTTGASAWWELLLTPVFEKVNICTTGAELNCGGRIDAPKEPVYTVEFLNMAWNASLDIADDLTALTWDLDTDTSSVNPVDLLNGGVLNAFFGQMGARAGGNSPLTNGFPLFAQISSCQEAPGSIGGSIKTCGGLAGGISCTDDTPCSGNTLNGTAGTNRTGSNNCYFEGKTGGVANAQLPYGLALPKDDDSPNGYCRRTDALDNVDRQKSCHTNAECVATPDFPFGNGICTTVDAVVDNFVTQNGPIRNMDFTQDNGPDMRFNTLEDLYGDAGTSFQGSLGFFISEGTTNDQPVSGFGVALDDVVVEWREFRLDPDGTPCSNVGQCATINISQTNGYEGNALVHITVQDASPYAPANNKNDCNGDGDFTDIGKCSNSNTACTIAGDCGAGTCDANASFADDQDCNNNGILDVTVRVISASETVGEIAVLDRVGSTSAYVVDFPVSSSYDSPGVIFIARSGTSNPQVRAQYLDRDDGTGNICPNNADITERGLFEDATTITLASGRISLRNIRLTDNGDNDGFADTNETVSMFVTVTNKSGQDLSDLTATLQSSDPKIECISGTTVSFTGPANPLLDKQTRESLTPFVFRVKGTTQRSIVNERFFATFQMNVRSERFDVGARALPISVELDLNASGGGATVGYSESFESATRTAFLSFTSSGANLDANKATLPLSDGYRCQYNDPFGPNPNEAARASCFMGFVNAANNQYDWHIHSGGALDNNVGRAYVGTRSLHWGVHPTALGAKRDTTRFAQLEGLRSLNPLNLPVATTPELSFKHQVSFTDNRVSNTADGESSDRGMVALQLADAGTGAGFGDWIKIYPYENEYDAQGSDGFANCTFDPIDDGNDEDDYFDPTDPLRRLGPSSTCFPEFNFAWGGNTDYQKSPGDLSLIGRAEGPGLRGQIDRGTWVQPKFLLDAFKGRRVRLRFLATTIEVETAVTVNDTNVGGDDEPGDDGWYIDDVSIPQVLQTPVLLAVDNAANAGLAACVNCTTVNAVMTLDPTTSTAPGQPVVLDASGSSANACPSGSLQFKFWNDANNSNTIDTPADVVLRDWTDNPVYLDAPLGQTAPSTAIHYAVQVRCSTDVTCGGAPAAFNDLTVTCPTVGSLAPLGPFGAAITFSTKNIINFTSQIHDAIRGDLITLRSSAKFNGTVRLCLGDNASGGTITDLENPVVGGGAYYLLRNGNHECNQLGTWSTNNVKERAGRDIEIGQDPRTCP